MDKSLLRIVFLALLFCLISNAFAGEPLTAQKVEQWISAQNALEIWGKKHHEEISKYEEQAEVIQNPMQITAEGMLEPLKAAGLYQSAKTIVVNHGFTSLEEWAETTLLITKTVAAIELEKQPKAMETSELEALMNSPQISEEQKAMLAQAIEQNLAVVKYLTNEIKASDKNIVQPFLSRINRLMEETE